MKNIINLLIKDIKKRAKSPWAIIIMLIIPLIMTGIFGAIFSPKKNVMPKIKMLICDKDNSAASGFFRGIMENQNMRDRFTISFVKEEEGKETLKEGKASALIIIPEGFQNNILNNIKTNFILLKNPSEQFLPQITQEFLETFSVLLSGLVTVFSEEIQILKNNENISLEKIDLTVMLPHMKKLQKKITALRKFLSPLLIKLESSVEETKDNAAKSINMFQAFLPGISIMFVLFFVEIFLRDILIEKDNGTLSRIMLTPVTSVQYITSKVLTGLIMGIFSQGLIYLSGSLLFDINWGSPLKLAAITLSSSLYIAAFFAVINALCKTKKQAENIASPVILISAALGGSMLPYNMLPDILKTLSPVTVNYWYINGMNQIMTGNDIIMPVLVLTGAGCLLMLTSFLLLPGRLNS